MEFKDEKDEMLLIESLPWRNCSQPINDKEVHLLCDDYSGYYVMPATFILFKEPQKINGKLRKGRWVNRGGENLSRKETPHGWLNKNEYEKLVVGTQWSF